MLAFRIIALVCLFSASLLDVGLYAGELELQRVYRSAHYLGRGDTGIAIADDHEAIFYNPAGLAFGKGLYKEIVLLSPTIEVSTSTRDLARKIAYEEETNTNALRAAVGKSQALGGYNFTGLVFRRAALGIVSSAQTEILVSKSVENRGLETVSARTVASNALTFSLAEEFFKNSLLIGTTVKHYLQRAQGQFTANIIDANELDNINKDELLGQGGGTGIDFGLMWRGGSRVKRSMGITVENIGDTVLSPDSPGQRLDNLKQTINVGFAIEPVSRLSTIKILADFRDVAGAVETNGFKKAHIGTEISIKDAVGFTIGLNQGYPTGGFYTDIYVFRLDIGAYSQEAGDAVGNRPDSRFFLRLKAGL